MPVNVFYRYISGPVMRQRGQLVLEVDVYIHLLVLLRLLDVNNNEGAIKCSGKWWQYQIYWYNVMEKRKNQKAIYGCGSFYVKAEF